MGDFQNTTMFTHTRLSDFVNGYKDYVDQIIVKAQNEGDLFKYNHYEYSPNGIMMTPLGRIPAAALSGVSSWTNNSGATNTPDGWKMNLGVQYNAIKTADQQTLATTPIANGLQYKAIILPNVAYSTNPNTFLANLPLIMNTFSDASGTTVLQQGTTPSMDTYADAFQDPNMQIPAKAVSNAAAAFGVEWNGFFSPTTLGNYIFTVNLGSTGGYVYGWIGNKAVCEYIPQNADITATTTTFTFNATYPGYYPVRLQYYNGFNVINPTFTFSLTVQQQSTTGTLTTVPTSSCFYVINGGNYVPPLLYCAFVSQSPTYLKSGKFLCYTLTLPSTSSASLTTFYQILNTYKFAMQAQQYDVSQGVVQFGQVPDGVTYTPVSSDVNSLPEVFSIYRLDVDLRMGKTFQIDTRPNGENLYTMRQVNPNPPAPNTPILSFAGDYHQLPNYYPNAPTGATDRATDLSGEACKLACNANQNCNHYFTYTSNGTPKCIIDTTNSVPNFNQIQPTTGTVSPMDAGSSSLFMRNLQFVEPTCNGITSNGGVAGPIAQIKTVDNVNDYTNSTFPYSNYLWNKDMVNSVTDIGVCGDSKFRTLSNDAAQILFQQATYNSNGTWTVNGQPGQDTQQWSAWQPGTSTEGFQVTAGNPVTIVVPAPATKYTDAISDTADAIQANLYNEQQYAHLMDKISHNYQQLSQQDIPQYENLRKRLNNNVNADFNGNTLLYVRQQPIPTVQQRNIMDIDEQNKTQNMVYVLGTITVATLLVLAILIARE